MVLRVESRVTRIIEVQRRRWGIVNSAPFMNLFFTVLVNSFLLVKPLECSIVSFIQSPVVMNRQMRVLLHVLKSLN